MEDINLESIDYWAEEFTVPLYIITDQEQLPFEDNFLCVYKDNTSRFYFINNRWEDEEEIGFEYFKKENSLSLYSKKVVKMLDDLDQLPKRNLDFMQLIRMMREWNEIYFETEAVRLSKFENEKDERILANLSEVAKLRLQMREQAEKILFTSFELVLEDVSKKYALEIDDIIFYDFSEFKALFKSDQKVKDDEITLRKQGYSYWRKSGKGKLVVGDQFKKIWNEINSQLPDEGITELKGSIANKGIVRGKVQVILHNQNDISGQVNNFKAGNILVTEMTRPQTITACNKASAIITDEGGITCHASILARELNIPCIIATKVASKILKDGTLVEVDANKGVVRILG